MKTLFDSVRHQELVDRLGYLRPDSPRRWGRMTAPQMLCHLSDSFQLVMGEQASDFRADTLFNRTLGRLMAVTLPIPWPKGLPTSPDADQEQKGTPPGDFAADVARLIADMERFGARGGQDMPPHLALGHLSMGEWGRWGYRHMDHHLRQFGV